MQHPQVLNVNGIPRVVSSLPSDIVDALSRGTLNGFRYVPSRLLKVRTDVGTLLTMGSCGYMGGASGAHERRIQDWFLGVRTNTNCLFIFSSV